MTKSTKPANARLSAPWWYAQIENGYSVGCGDVEFAQVSTRAAAAAIAAAPDMLAALETLNAWLVAPDTSGETFRQMRRIAQDAIRKAAP